MTKNRKNGFIMQAGILAVAGIICRIIGILYRSPLTSIIGDEGNGYYSSAYYIYTIILLISSYSIPSAISKVIAQRLALRQYENAHRVFKCAIAYVMVVGGIASLFAYFGAGILVEKNAIVVLRVFAPTIFLSGLLGVLRGYFQAHRTMIPTSISQILEQILNAIVSVVAALMFTNMVQTASSTKKAVYGAAGSALGTGSGVLIALLFMFLIYMINRNWILNRVRRDTSQTKESYKKILHVVFFMVTPIVLSTFIYNFSTTLNQTIYIKVLKNIKGFTESDIMTMYGIYAGKAVVISNIPIAMASAMSAAMIPTISGTYATGDKNLTKKKIADAIRTTMFISIPSAVGMFVLAKPITQLLFPQKSSLLQASSLLQVLSITVVFYALSTLTNAVLQGIGKVVLPVINAAVALVLQTMLLVPLLLWTNLNLYTLAFVMVFYSFLMCILNGGSVRKALHYKQEIKKTFVLPFVASAVMGGVAMGVYAGIHAFLKSNVIALIPALAASALVYFVVIIKIGGINEGELAKIPKGSLLVKAAKKLHML